MAEQASGDHIQTGDILQSQGVAIGRGAQAHSGGHSFQMGDVGAGATVQQGWNQTMTVLRGAPGGDDLARRFEALTKRINEHPGLDAETKQAALETTQAVAEGLAQAQKKPSMLRSALNDAKATLGAAVGWVLEALRDILKSDAAQQTIGTITEATTKAAIASFH